MLHKPMQNFYSKDKDVMNRSNRSFLPNKNLDKLNQIWRQYINGDLDSQTQDYSKENQCNLKEKSTDTVAVGDPETSETEIMDLEYVKKKEDSTTANAVAENEDVERYSMILVTNLPCKISKEDLQSFFQAYGEIVDISVPSIPTGSAIAVVTFRHSGSVEKILSPQKPIIFCGEPEYFLLKVSNLPKDIPFKEVYNIFKEHGEIVDPPNICVKEAEHLALIPFASIDAVDHLLEKSNGTLSIRYDTHDLHLEKAFGDSVTSKIEETSDFAFSEQPTAACIGKNKDAGKLETKKLNEVRWEEVSTLSNVRRQEFEKMPSVKDKPPCSAVIQIRNICKLSSIDLLSKYLKNPRSGSSGDAVKEVDCEIKFDLAVVEYYDLAIAERVLSLNPNGKHILEGQTIYVSKLPPKCKNRLFLSNVPQWVTMDGLKNYLESKAHNDVKDVKFNDVNDGAIITFSKDVDVDLMAASFKERPFKDGSNQIKPDEFKPVSIVCPDAVLVYASGCSEDSVVYALEDHLRSIAPPDVNSAVRYAIYRPEKEIWLVCFEDYNIVISIPTMFQLAINGNNYLVVPYFDCLGWRPKDGKGKADFLREHSSAALHQELSQTEANFFTSNVGRNYVEMELEKNNIKGVFAMETSSLIRVVAEDKEQSQKMVQFILNCVKTINFQLDEEMLLAWNEKAAKFLECNNSADIGNYFAWSLKNSILCFTVATSKVESVKNMISGFFGNNAIYEKNVVSVGIEGLYLKKFHETEIVLKCSNAGTVKFQPNGSIRMNGTKAQLGTLEADIRVLLTDIEVSEYIVKSPGMSSFFQNQSAFTDISAISDRTHTLIIFEDDLVKESHQVVTSSNSFEPTNKMKLEGYINGNIKVDVHQGDITVEYVKAIVNAANEDLQHFGGIAKTIVDNGGPYIQAECDKFIKRNGPLNVAENYVSSAGELPCEKIIHAVGPRYKVSSAGSDKDLRSTISNIIQVSMRQGFDSIAIPAISTCNFGYPIEKAIPIIVDAVVSSSAENICIKEIRFVDTNATAVRKFIEEIKNCEKFCNIRGSSENKVISVVKKPVSINRSQTSATVFEKQPYISSIVDRQSNITLLKDNIVNVAKVCDVIVNTTGSGAKDMVGSGNACKAIAAAAGQSYVDDVLKYYPNGIGKANLAVTKAGSLGCKHVYHISCPEWDREVSLNVLKDKVVACLNEMDKQKLASIAFPAIGTGILKYPADLVVSTMYNAVATWFKFHTNCSLKTVYFVVFPFDVSTVSAFEKEFVARSSGTLQNSSELHPVQLLKHNKDAHMSATNTVQINGINVELITKVDPSNKIDCAISSIVDNSINGSFKSVFRIESPKDDLIKWQTSFEQTLTRVDKIFTSVLIVAFENGVSTQLVGEKILGVIKTFAMEYALKLALIQILVPETDISLMCGILSTLFNQVKNKGLIQRVLDRFGWGSSESESGSALSVNNRQMEEVANNLKLHVCGPKTSVGIALSMLDKICEEKCPERIILKYIIKELDDNAINHLRKDADRYGVNFRMNQEQNKITIKGFKAAEYRDILVGMLDTLTEEYEREIQNKDATVEWFKRQNKQQTWQLIPDGYSKLETEYKKASGIGFVVLSNFEDKSNVSVDFNNMIMSSSDKTVLFYLKRREVTDSIPMEWDYNGKPSKDNEYVLVQLDPTSTEYNDIKMAMFATAPAVSVIKKIERVENPVKFMQYQALKRQLEHTLPPSVVAERKLFHGTNGANIVSVCTTGFDRGLAGVHAVAFGHGSYFARDFSYSMGYTNSGTIFYAFVLTGQFTVGNTGMKTAPVADLTKGTKFDSVVDNMANPSIFVAFTDNHAYPAYLITYA